MTLDYAAAGDLLDRYREALEQRDGDAFTELFRPEAEFHADPFAPPVVGHNGLRAMLLEAARVQDALEFTIERHWVVPPTILAAWHASSVIDGSPSRMAGFMTLEVAADGRIGKVRVWWNVPPGMR